MIGVLAVGVVTASGCGAGTYANRPSPPEPVNLTVYINDSRVSVSPSFAGAGPVVLFVTNQASNAESLTILPADSPTAEPLADTGPINPQATAQVTVDFSSPGDYTVSTGKPGATDASVAGPSSVHPATLHIGPARRSASGALLVP